VRAAEGLEIISLIFYVFAGILIIIGIIDLERAPLEYMFGAAAILLFLCGKFIDSPKMILVENNFFNQLFFSRHHWV
jgi:uncharacterized membrane protein YobD (UPF0266 family)